MRVFLLSLALATAPCDRAELRPQIPTCTTRADCDRWDGLRVEVVGVYTVFDSMPSDWHKDGDPPVRQVLIKLGQENGPYLEPFGEKKHLRPLDEIARLDGKRVRVRGTYLRTMPPHPTNPPWATSLGGSCIKAVESIALNE